MAEATANIGVIGLATMGSNLARNLAHHGNTVALFNRHYSRTEKLMNEHGTEGNFVPAETLEEFAASLKRPRTAIIMVKGRVLRRRDPSRSWKRCSNRATSSSTVATPLQGHHQA